MIRDEQCPRWLKQPLRGEWSLLGYPDAVNIFLLGAWRRFERATFALDRYGAVAQYRQAIRHDALHLYVLPDATWIADQDRRCASTRPDVWSKML
jgi:hypothetical protein